jgi:hypothetical protein
MEGMGAPLGKRTAVLPICSIEKGDTFGVMGMFRTLSNV